MRLKPTVSALQTASVALCGCDPDELEPVAALLGQMGCVIQPAETIEQLELLLKSRTIDAILMQVCPSRQQFLPILGAPDLPPAIALLRHADKHLYLELLRRGAFDCVALPAQDAELKRVLSLAIEDRQEQMAASNAA